MHPQYGLQTSDGVSRLLSPCRANEQLRNVQTLQRRLTQAERAASEAAQQLAASRADADAAQAAVGIARKDTHALRAELRTQRGATAQVCYCLTTSKLRKELSKICVQETCHPCINPGAGRGRAGQVSAGAADASQPGSCCACRPYCCT